MSSVESPIKNLKNVGLAFAVAGSQLFGRGGVVNASASPDNSVRKNLNDQQASLVLPPIEPGPYNNTQKLNNIIELTPTEWQDVENQKKGEFADAPALGSAEKPNMGETGAQRAEDNTNKIDVSNTTPDLTSPTPTPELEINSAISIEAVEVVKINSQGEIIIDHKPGTELDSNSYFQNVRPSIDNAIKLATTFFDDKTKFNYPTPDKLTAVVEGEEQTDSQGKVTITPVPPPTPGQNAPVLVSVAGAGVMVVDGVAYPYVNTDWATAAGITSSDPRLPSIYVAPEGDSIKVVNKDTSAVYVTGAINKDKGSIEWSKVESSSYVYQTTLTNDIQTFTSDGQAFGTLTSGSKVDFIGKYTGNYNLTKLVYRVGNKFISANAGDVSGMDPIKAAALPTYDPQTQEFSPVQPFQYPGAGKVKIDKEGYINIDGTEYKKQVLKIPGKTIKPGTVQNTADGLETSGYFVGWGSTVLKTDTGQNVTVPVMWLAQEDGTVFSTTSAEEVIRGDGIPTGAYYNGTLNYATEPLDKGDFLQPGAMVLLQQIQDYSSTLTAAEKADPRIKLDLSLMQKSVRLVSNRQIKDSLIDSGELAISSEQ